MNKFIEKLDKANKTTQLAMYGMFNIDDGSNARDERFSMIIELRRMFDGRTRDVLDLYEDNIESIREDYTNEEIQEKYDNFLVYYKQCREELYQYSETLLKRIREEK